MCAICTGAHILSTEYVSPACQAFVVEISKLDDSVVPEHDTNDAKGEHKPVSPMIPICETQWFAVRFCTAYAIEQALQVAVCHSFEVVTALMFVIILARA